MLDSISSYISQRPYKVPIFFREETEAQRLNYLLKATQLISRRVRIQTLIRMTTPNLEFSFKLTVEEDEEGKTKNM